jgi:hypothetical protein
MCHGLDLWLGPAPLEGLAVVGSNVEQCAPEWRATARYRRRARRVEHTIWIEAMAAG